MSTIEKTALNHFTTNIALPRIRDTLIKTTIDFYENKDIWREGFINEIKRMFIASKEFSTSKNQDINYLSFTLLRTNLLYGKLVYDVHIYDKSWYLNDYVTIGEIDTSIFFQPLQDTKDYLNAECKKYVGKINAAHVDNIVSPYYEAFGYLFVKMFRYALLEITECSEYAEIMKADTFRMLADELYGKYYILHVETKDRTSIEKLNERIKNGEACRHFDLRNSTLTGVDMTNSDLQHSDFRGSSLKSIDLSNSSLEGCIFANCDLAASNFSGAKLSEANFQNANMQGANLSGAVSAEGIFEDGDWDSLCKLPLILNGTDMREAVIENAILPGVDFTRTKLEGAILTGTDLSGSRFKEEQLQHVNLSDVQRSQITVK